VLIKFTDLSQLKEFAHLLDMVALHVSQLGFVLQQPLGNIKLARPPLCHKFAVPWVRIQLLHLVVVDNLPEDFLQFAIVFVCLVRVVRD